MVTLQVSHVGFLVPELQQFGSAVILQSGQVGILLDVRVHELVQNTPGGSNALGINEDSANDRLKYISEYFEIILVQLI